MFSPAARAAVVALALAAAGTSSAARAPATCRASQLQISLETQGVSTTTWIGLSVRDRGPACMLDGVATTIDQRGRRAAVKGSPLRFALRDEIGHGRTRVLRADWSNWCGPRRGLTIRARYAGLVAASTFRHLPVCLSRSAPSRLAAIRTGS